MVVVGFGFGEGQGEVKGDGWWDPPGVFFSSPSTTSPPFSPSPLRGESLCSVLSGLERLEDEDVEEEEVVEEDSVQAGHWTGGSSAANET